MQDTSTETGSLFTRTLGRTACQSYAHPLHYDKTHTLRQSGRQEPYRYARSGIRMPYIIKPYIKVVARLYSSSAVRLLAAL